MRVVLLDVDGVLVQGYNAHGENQRRWDQHLLEDLGIEPGAFLETFVKTVFIQQVLVGRRSLVAALEEALPGLGYTGSPMDVVGYWLQYDSSLNLPLLAEVRRLQSSGAARLYMATNQEHLRASHLWNTLGLRHIFADMFYSARLGAIKPHKQFFVEIEKRLGRLKQPPLFFDDSEEVVAAARDFGWDAALYRTVKDFTGHPWAGAHLM